MELWPCEFGIFWGSHKSSVVDLCEVSDVSSYIYIYIHI